MTASIDTLPGLVASVLLIAANGFFVAAEFCLVAADRTRFSRDAAAGDRAAARCIALFRRLSFHLSGAQFGITATSLVLGFIAEPAVRGLISPVVGELPRAATVAIALLLATTLQMVFGELVPKTVAITYADQMVRVLRGPIWLYGVVAGPVIGVFENSSNRIIRLLGVEPRGELDATRSLEELRVLIQSSGEEGTLDPEHVSLLTRSIRFGEKTAADALVPRVEIQSIHRSASVADLVEESVRSGLSRFPVHGEDLDEVVGVVHVKSVLGLPVEDRTATPVEAIMTDVLAVPETRPLDDLFADFRSDGSYLAVVVDEHGGTAGIITLEDLLEELVGEIADEYDRAEDAQAPALTKAAEAGSYVVPGGWHADELRENCGFEMPEGEYETIAGFVLDRLGHIPEPGERIHHEGWTVEVVAMDRLRVAAVRLAAPRDEPDQPDQPDQPLLGGQGR